jgi:hypothetical protein
MYKRVRRSRVAGHWVADGIFSVGGIDISALSARVIFLTRRNLGVEAWFPLLTLEVTAGSGISGMAST